MLFVITKVSEGMEQVLKIRPSVADPVELARIDLAALHRTAEQRGWSESIVNHMTMMVPGTKSSR